MLLSSPSFWGCGSGMIFPLPKFAPSILEGFLSAIGLWCVITLLVFWIFRLYNSIWAFVSTPEVFRITGAYVVLGVIGVLVFHFDGNLMPRSSMVVGFLFSFVSTVAIRSPTGCSGRRSGASATSPMPTA